MPHQSPCSFKSKVQQKIMEMSKDLRNPSPMRQSSHLDSYIKKQEDSLGNRPDRSYQFKVGSKLLQASLDSMHNNYEGGSSAHDVATARFSYANTGLGGTVRLQHQ